MKFSTLFVAALVPALALAQEPTNHPDFPVVEARDLEKRAVSGKVKVDGLRYRTCPKRTCTAVGQYSKGTKVSLKCWTNKGTTTENGDAGWAKLSNGNWVAMGNGKYISWSSTLYSC